MIKEVINVNLQVIMAPIIGGFIGLITNSLAIKMLFRPYNEIKIAGVRIPFTPGLIPKEKSRIAQAISKVITSYILDQKTILSALASDQMKEAYEKKYDQVLSSWKSTDLTFEQLLQKYDLEDWANISESKMVDVISNYMIKKCQEEELARKLIIQAFSSLKDNMHPFLYKIGKKALISAQEDMISKAEQLISEHGKETIEQFMNLKYRECLDQPVSAAVIALEDHVPDLKNMIWNKYLEFLQNKFGTFLSTLNIQRIIEDKINAYNFNELENMIMEISKKELNALVWFGGLLGVMMGFINLLF